jgi:hypothetical protein
LRFLVSAYAIIPVRLKNEIAIDDNAHRNSGADVQRTLNIEAAPNDLLACLIQRISGTMP